MTPRPLDGVRVLDLTRLLPGAYATLTLADLGADVVKIEDPRGGDPARRLPAIAGGRHAYFEIVNRDKRSVTLDLRADAARPVLDALIARADVSIESFRPQTARRLGLDGPALCARHRRLVHASLSGFGSDGNAPSRAAHDINFEALTGLLALQPGEPKVPGMLIGDIGGALQLASGVLAALYQRERTGRGGWVRVAIRDAALSWLMFPAARTLMDDGGARGADLPLDGRSACYNIYRTLDGRHLALGALEPKFWTAFCERIGRPDLAPLQFAEGSVQARAVDDVRRLIGARTQAEWLSIFADTDVCLTPVVGVAEAVADPDLKARGIVVPHEGRRYIASPIDVVPSVDAVGGRGAATIRPAPALGEHTDDVLDEAGVSRAERARLRELGVI